MIVEFPPVILCSFVRTQLSFGSVYDKDIRTETFVPFSSLPQDRPSSLPSLLLTFSNSLGHSSALAALAARTILSSSLFPLSICIAPSVLCSPRRLYSRILGSSTRLYCSHVTLVVSLSRIHSRARWPHLSSFPTLPYQSRVSAPRNLRTRFRARSQARTNLWSWKTFLDSDDRRSTLNGLNCRRKDTVLSPTWIGD